MTCIEEIYIQPTTITVFEGKWFYGATAHIVPSDATCQSVRWSSEDSSIASVNATTGAIYGQSAGTTTIYATSCDGSGVRCSCNVTVKKYISATRIEVDPEQIKMPLHTTAYITASIYPLNATTDRVSWEIDGSAVEIYSCGDTLVVTAKKVGTAVLTATCDEVSATCTITVDAIESVMIEEDNSYDIAYYRARFKDGKVWNIIGKNKEDPGREDVFYARRNANQAVVFSKKQLAYLYLLDPLGVQYYVKNYKASTVTSMSDIDFLFFKDDVYYEIFHEKPRLFLLMPSGKPQFYNDTTSSPSLRNSVYSDAEIIFGEHVPEPRHPFTIAETVTDISLTLFAIIPGTSGVVNALNLCSALFFMGSVKDALSSQASNALKEYAEDLLDSFVVTEETINTCFSWVSSAAEHIFDVGCALANLITPDNLCDIPIYQKVAAQDYRTVFKSNNSEVSMQELLDHYNSL